MTLPEVDNRNLAFTDDKRYGRDRVKLEVSPGIFMLNSK